VSKEGDLRLSRASINMRFEPEPGSHPKSISLSSIALPCPAPDYDRRPQDGL